MWKNWKMPSNKKYGFGTNSAIFHVHNSGLVHTEFWLVLIYLLHILYVWFFWLYNFNFNVKKRLLGPLLRVCRLPVLFVLCGLFQISLLLKLVADLRLNVAANFVFLLLFRLRQFLRVFDRFYLFLVVNVILLLFNWFVELLIFHSLRFSVYFRLRANYNLFLP